MLRCSKPSFILSLRFSGTLVGHLEKSLHTASQFSKNFGVATPSTVATSLSTRSLCSGIYAGGSYTRVRDVHTALNYVDVLTKSFHKTPKVFQRHLEVLLNLISNMST